MVYEDPQQSVQLPEKVYPAASQKKATQYYAPDRMPKTLPQFCFENQISSLISTFADRAFDS
jgi:hypothetical protein